MESRPRVLILARGYFPFVKYGGPPISIRNLCRFLKGNFDCYIVTRNHEHKQRKQKEVTDYGWKKMSECTVMYISEKEMTLRCYKKIVEDIKPYLIYLNSFFDAKLIIPMLQCSKQCNVPCLIAPRGEFAQNAIARKKYKKRPYVVLFRKIFKNNQIWYQAANEREKEDIIRELRCDDNKVVILSNIPSIPKTLEIKTGKEKGKLNVIFLGRIMPVKNLSLALDIIKKLKGNVIFNIYGPIEDDLYWGECQAKIKEYPPEIKVNYGGVISHDDVYKTLRRNELLLLPSMTESYGQSIAEALYAGIPVVTSNQTPWKSLEKKKCGYSGSLDNLESFVEIMQMYVDMSDGEFRKHSQNAIDYIKSDYNVLYTKAMYESFFNTIGNNL